jgi:hypothetical protein
MTFITADPGQLLEQAGWTAGGYLRQAVGEIDGVFGKGYAKANPTLVAAFMQTAAIDFATAVACKSVGEAADAVAEAIREARWSAVDVQHAELEEA